MEVIVRKGFNIKKFRDDQPFTGNCSNAQTYALEVMIPGTDEEDAHVSELMGTLKSVTPVTDGDNEITDYLITFSTLWYEKGPKDESKTLSMAEILSMKQVFVKYKTMYKRDAKDFIPTDRDDCFVFRVGASSITVTPDTFVKICYTVPETALKKGEDARRVLFGYFTDVNDEGICKIKSIENISGLFNFNEIELPADSIYAVYYARVDMSIFESKKAAAKKAKKAKKAVAPAGMSDSAEPDVSPEATNDPENVATTTMEVTEKPAP